MNATKGLRIIAVILLVVCILFIVIPFVLVMHIEQSNGRVAKPASIPYIGLYIENLPNAGEIEYSAKKGQGACVVYFSGKVSDYKNLHSLKIEGTIGQYTSEKELKFIFANSPFSPIFSQDSLIYWFPNIGGGFQVHIYVDNMGNFIGKAAATRIY
ncbi:MAG: hypothetical protein JXB18_00075 [Sedimentisphaerales bacterium]|nr:hypothetical protein [Sedimentisphaerales bacterium]